MFLNVVMLAGIAGAAVPLVLHLLSRARYRPVPWAAMMFLHDVEPRLRQSTRLRQWLLLAVRMSIVALLALALARPVTRGRLGALGQHEGATVVILLDHSTSMAVSVGGHTRMDDARQIVAQILANLHHGDAVQIIPMGDIPAANAPQIFQRPTADLQMAIDALDDPQLQSTGWGVADMADGLKLAADTFAHSPGSDRQLFVVCDRQAVNWRQVNDQFAKFFRDRLGSPAPKFMLIPVGGWDADNIALQSIAPRSGQMITGQPGEVDISIRNYGQIDHASVPIRLYVGEQQVAATAVRLAAGSAATVHQSIVIPSPESSVITAKLEAADSSVGAQCQCAVDVQPPINVRVIRPAAWGTAQPGPQGRADYFDFALMPFASAGRQGADIAAVTVTSYSAQDDWSDLDHHKYPVVVLDGIAEITAAQARALEQHVYAGGGLLVSPGAFTRVDNLNSMLFRDAAGVLPAALGRATPPDHGPATTITSIDRSHSIFHFLTDRPDPDASAAVSRFFPVTALQPEAHVLASYATGSPFLVAGAFGRGKVVLVTTSLSEDWSTLPRTNLYLPLVQNVVRFLASRPSRNLSPGQPIVALFDQPAEAPNRAPPARVAQVLPPSGQQRDVNLQAAGDLLEARFADTNQPGVYTISFAGQTLHYVVSAPADESDLTPLPPAQWKLMADKLGFQIVDPAQTPIASLMDQSQSPREMWAALLAAVIGLAVVEVLLGRVWAHSSAPVLPHSLFPHSTRPA